MMNWKDKLRYGMSKMLYGRYGMDELGRFLWAAVIVLLIINLFVPNLILTALTLIVLIWMYARFFSKHYDRRRAENARYLKLSARCICVCAMAGATGIMIVPDVISACGCRKEKGRSR